VKPFYFATRCGHSIEADSPRSVAVMAFVKRHSKVRFFRVVIEKNGRGRAIEDISRDDMLSGSAARRLTYVAKKMAA
jgi:hypothetical protein